MGAPIITGAARATVATGREAVAVAEADVAARLAAGTRRRSCASSRIASRASNGGFCVDGVSVHAVNALLAGASDGYGRRARLQS